jgi:predicted site-specific integrase-resolvase
MNLREWAEAQHIHPQTAYRWCREGRLPVPAQRVGGLIVVGDLTERAFAQRGKTAIYARVSSADQKTDLDRQVSRVTTWATSNGYSIDSVVGEVGSALNGKRAELLSMLGDPDATTIIVEHRDRFARFGAEYVACALDAEDRRMVIVDDPEVDDDLVEDMGELMGSLCARLYGRRSAGRRAAKAICAVTVDAGVGGGSDG